MKQMKFLLSLLAASTLLMGCAGEEFTDPEPATKTGFGGIGSALFDATGLTRTLTAPPHGESAVCSTPVIGGNVPAGSYFNASLTNGVLAIKGSGFLAQATAPGGYCATGDYCACTELTKLAYTNPAVNNNQLKISGKIKMPNINANRNIVVFQRAFKANLLGTNAEDTILYQVMVVRAGANATAAVTRLVSIDGGTPLSNNDAPTLTGAFSSGDEQDFSITMAQTAPATFKITVTVGVASADSVDLPGTPIGSPKGTEIATNVVLGGLFNAVPTSAVNVVLFTNQGTTQLFNAADAPTITNLKITQ